jgi:hypothetical protein
VGKISQTLVPIVWMIHESRGTGKTRFTLNVHHIRMHLYVLYLLASILPLTVLASHEDQMVMPELSNFPPTEHTQPSLYDLLTIEPSLSIFFSYARETEASNLFSDKQARSTLLVPTNKAVMDLARKP